jgi:hypothetical protein
MGIPELPCEQLSARRVMAQGANDVASGRTCRTNSGTGKTIGETDIHGSHKLGFAKAETRQ